MKKQISLNKTIVIGVMVLYTTFLLAITCLDFFLVSDYQREQQNQQWELLNNRAANIEQDIRSASSDVYNVYTNDVDFAALTRELSEEETYSHVYEVSSDWKQKMFLEDNIHGYILYYDGKKQNFHRIDMENIDTMTYYQLEKLIDENYGWISTSKKWNMLELNGELYAIYIQEKGMAAFCAIYRLDAELEKLEKEAGSQVNVFWLKNKKVYGMENVELKEDVLKGIEDEETHFRIKQDGQLIYGRKLENQNELWMCMAIPVTFFNYMNVPLMVLSLLTICSVVGAVFLVLIMKKELVYPIRELENEMNAIRDGNWEVSISQGSRFTEISNVKASFVLMLQEITKQKMISYEQTIEKQKAQMQYLQLQLKPHFYLNGLKTLNVLAMNKDTDKMQEMIMNLSYHLRYLLQTEREMVSLKAEIDYVKNYVLLQNNMTGRKFSVNWHVEEGLEHWIIPTLSMQTFVENSFKYAKLGNVNYELILDISVNELHNEEGSFLDIRIRDNGQGYPQQILEEINGEPVEGSHSVGIHNLKRRCRMIYKEKAEFDFYNDEGAISEMVLPWRE